MTTRSRLLDVVIDLTALAAAALVMSRVLRYMDPRSVERTRAQRRGRKQLSLRLQHGARSKELQLTEHEAEVAADVVVPDEVDVSFSDIGGLADQARHLRRAILLPLTRPRLFDGSRLLHTPKGVLLHGPPGTGKTMLARAIAREASFNFIALNPARLLSKWYGESNKLADAYFSLAHKIAPSVLFIDEVDLLFSRGAGKGHEHEATSMLKAQFLALWDGLLSPSAAHRPVIVVAATNRVAMVDGAVLRRLPLTFEVPLPDLAAREDVLRRLLRGEILGRSLDLHSVAAETGGYSGSDLEQLCKSAALRCLEDFIEAEGAEGVETVEGARSHQEQRLRDLTVDDFRHAMRRVKPTTRFEPKVSTAVEYDEELYD